MVAQSKQRDWSHILSLVDYFAYASRQQVHTFITNRLAVYWNHLWHVSPISCKFAVFFCDLNVFDKNKL